MSGYRRTLAQLREQLPTSACPVCGFDPNAPVTFAITTDELGSPFYRETALPDPTICALCGRSDRPFTINIEYGNPDDEELYQ